MENDQNIVNSKNNLNVTPRFENPYVNLSNSNNSNSYKYNSNQKLAVTAQVKPNYFKGVNLIVSSNTNIGKEPDEVSTFSIFSNFKNILQI